MFESFGSRGRCLAQTHTTVSAGIAAILTVVLTAACSGSTDSSDSTATASPTGPVQYASGREAFEAIQRSDSVTCRGLVLPGDMPGQIEVLVCHKVFVPPSDHTWQVTVWLYEDEFFAERQYRKDCHAFQSSIGPGEWVVWEQGQSWVAAVRDATISIADVRKPPRSVAEEVASALGSTAWDTCDALT